MQHNFKKLNIWQESIDFVVDAYALTKKFPESEKFNLVSQMNRNIVSIPSNIAEGSKTSTTLHFQKYLDVSLGSAAEWYTQLVIAKKLSYISEVEFLQLEEKINKIQNMIYRFKKGLDSPKS